MGQHKSAPSTGVSRTFLLGIKDIFVIIYIILLNSLYRTLSSGIVGEQE